ncbi:Xaa-Pro peptidase family protein [Bradyrhizobium brasilense]|uniref:M24 family metallopeptidase n=1 Tax=Bradyrhizobium brasilense TaxID=1419277 RepID=UPI002877DA2F|nr:Xaa-Pro peptidase family protein [Bradyrhizobium brasilense]MCP3413647.1 Xaa-Pro peptidase family protein [Bradyrhizobium brasilense]
MARADLDALLVTAHGHLRYLTGYDGLGGYFMPFPLILAPGRAGTYVVREYEVNGVRAESCIDEIVAYAQQQDFAKICADVLRRYGLESGRVGFELGCWNLAPADVRALQAELPNMKVADATRLVPSVSVVKSELEIKAMRDAMAMTDVAVRTFLGVLRDGVTEAEVAAAIHGEVRKADGDDVRLFSLSFGERTKLPHGRPTRHPIRNNEPAMIEVGGAKYAYAAGLVRSAVLGRHTETESLHGLAERALEAALAAIKPGITAGEVDAAGRKVIEQSGFAEVFRHRTGYQSGINWGERGNLSLEPGAVDLLQAGMTLHIPFILFSESGYLFGCSENILVTNSGAEILSRTPHTLNRA